MDGGACVSNSISRVDFADDFEDTVPSACVALTWANSFWRSETSVSKSSSRCVLWVALELVGELPLE